MTPDGAATSPVPATGAGRAVAPVDPTGTRIDAHRSGVAEPVPARDTGHGAAVDLAAAVELAAESLALVQARSSAALHPKLPPTQLRALQVIESHESINLGGLAEALGMIASSASRLCDRLEAAGLVVRHTATEDRRTVALALTGSGARLLTRLRTARRADLAEVLVGMSEGGRAALLRGLREFHAATRRLDNDEWLTHRAQRDR